MSTFKTFSLSLDTVGTAKIYELRAFVKKHHIGVMGDKRRKATYIVAITAFLVYWDAVNNREFVNPDFGYIFDPETEIWENEDGDQLNDHDYNLMVEMAYAEGLV